MSHLTAVPASSHADQEGNNELQEFPRTVADGTLTPAQGEALAVLVNSLYPEWSVRDVYDAVGGAVATSTGGAAEVVLAMLNVATDPGNGLPGAIRFPGQHWEAARQQASK